MGNEPVIYLEEVLAERVLPGKERLVRHAKIRWAGRDAEETSWEEIEHLQRVFPSLNLEDKIDSEGDSAR